MKKTITLISLLLFSFTNIYSQIVIWDFCEDFEDFNANDYIAQTSDNWNTWGELMSGWTAPFNDDAMVVNDTASSGNNSLYFIDATGQGGPQDIILMFDTTPNITASTLSTLSTPYVGGNFSFSQKMFVVPGKTGYFNFQEENIPGTSWALQVELDSLGNINMTNGAVAPIFSTTYYLGVWFEISFDIDLSNNLWEVYIDGVLQGSFSNVNPTTMLPYKIASLDLYPAISSEFYVDEICFSYTPPTPTWDCDGQGNCNDPGTGTGQYSTLSACQAACPQISWDCNPTSGTCINPGNGTGQYSTYQQCVSVCGVNTVNDIESKLEVYPNPVKDILNIKGDYEELYIYDMFGKEVLKREKTQKINISNLSSGIYFLKIRKEGKEKKKKIIIEN